MVEPTSDLGEDVDEKSAPECDACGERILNESDHRVVTWVEDDRVQHRHFCDDECEAAWDRSERPSEAGPTGDADAGT